MRAAGGSRRIDAVKPVGIRTGQEKAAILLLLLGSDLGKSLLQKFGAGDIRKILASARHIGDMDRDDLERLIDDFAAQFGTNLGITLDFEAMQTLVAASASPGSQEALLGGDQTTATPSIWTRITSIAEKILVPYLLDEHPQTVAFILSRLNPETGARCLSILPGDFRMTVARRLMHLGEIHPDILAVVEHRIDIDILNATSSGTSDRHVSHLADMLNLLDREQSASILDTLAGQQPEEDVRKLRSLVLSFEDLENLSVAARTALLDRFQTAQIATALRGMPDAFTDLMLTSLGARARRTVEAELQQGTPLTAGDIQTARREMTTAALGMARRGEIELFD